MGKGQLYPDVGVTGNNAKYDPIGEKKYAMG